MTLDIFFKKFDQFADAPNAVAKMRELVLQLAVQGKLVEQKHGEGNAKAIFSDSHPEKGERRHEIPATWLWIRFASVGEQRLGKMLDQRGNRGDLKPYLRNTNLQWMRFQLDDIKELRLAPEELEEFRLQPDDLLICEGGEPGRCAIWRDPHQEMYFQKAIHRVRPRKGILSDYLAICLQVDAQNGVLAKQFTGATIKHFTGRSLREYSIALPPFAEQKRIVAKVDELMALCDRLEAQQQERDEQASALARASLARFAEAPTPANLNLLFHKSYSISPADLRKAILAMAVHGKLVSQDFNDEPATEIVKRAIDEKVRLVKQGELKREKPLPRNDSHRIPYDLPKGWCWIRLGELSHTVTSGSRDWATHYSDDGAIFVRMGNLSRNSYKLRLDKIQYITPPSNTEGQRTKLESGDILISITGEVGLLGLIPEEFGEAYINQHTCLVRLPRELHNRYIPEFFRSPVAQDQFNAPQRGLKNSFRLTDVTTLLTPLPPLAEQRRIVAKVDQLMALVDQLEAQLADSRATAKNLLEALVAELTAA